MNNEVHVFEKWITILIVLAGAVALNIITRSLLNKKIRLSSSKINVNPVNYLFLKQAVSVAIFSITGIVIFHLMPGLEKIGSTLLASAGILSVVLGLAAQQTFGNIFSGLSILLNKPYRVYDFIQLSNGNKGWIEDITLQYTLIRLTDDRKYVVPNSIISKDYIINASSSNGQVCINIALGIPADSDIVKAKHIIRDIITTHEDFVDKRTGEEKENGAPAVHVTAMNITSNILNVQASFWCISSRHSSGMNSDVLYKVSAAFKENNIAFK